MGVVGALAVLAGGYGVHWWVWSLNHERTDDAFIDGHLILVSPRVKGYVRRVLVEDNQAVEAGTLLVELDGEPYQVQVEQAEAALKQAKARYQAEQEQLGLTRGTTQAALAEAEAGLAAAKSAAAAAEAAAERDRITFEQTERSYQAQAATLQEYERARAAMRSSDAQAKAAQDRAIAGAATVESARAQLQRVPAQEAQVRVLEAAVKQAEAGLVQAKLNLQYTQIRASEAGRVTNKSVEAGQWVVEGQAMLALVPKAVWVTANYKETQLTHMKPGQPVEIRVDAFPKARFRGWVDSVQAGTGAVFSLLPPQNATGNYVKVVQRVPVKIVFDPPPGEDSYFLAPGMSVVPTVDTHAAGRAPVEARPWPQTQPAAQGQ